MNTKNLFIVIGAIIILLIAGIVFFNKSAVTPGSTSPSENTVTPYQSPTHSAVPRDAMVPGKGTTNASPNLAVPMAVAQAGPSGSAEFRGFQITVKNNQFTPDTVAVYQGDEAHISFLAVDKDYDFAQPDYGLRSVLHKGKVQPIEFQATTVGTFTFYCERCGGLKGPLGYIIVVPKK